MPNYQVSKKKVIDNKSTFKVISRILGYVVKYY